MDGPLLSAVLVVRNEAGQLADCLASLRPLVDEVVVHDTGSTDETVQIARAAGAAVHEGFWDDDFARARNVALDLAHAPWALVLDADERAVTDPLGAARLRRLLAGSEGGIPADILTVAVHNEYPEELGGGYRHPGPRLLRRSAVRYRGRVHEEPVSAGGLPAGVCPPETLTIRHLGYRDADVVRAKAARNAQIAQAELDRLTADPGADPQSLAKVLLDLGRSLVLCDRRPAAAGAFTTLRALAPGTPRAVEATDALARLLLAAGLDTAVLGLAEELRAAGIDDRYCDWLRAQALAQLGEPVAALGLLRGIDVLRDSAGRELDLGQVIEMRALTSALAGVRDEAVATLVRAMVGHGRIAGRGSLLLDLWAQRPPGQLAALLLEAAGAGPGGGVHLGEVAAELAGCHAPGPEVSSALGRTGDVPPARAGR